MENSMRNLVMIDLDVIADEIVKGIKHVEILKDDTPEIIYEQLREYVLEDLENFSTEVLQMMIVAEFGGKVIQEMLNGGAPNDY